MAEETRRPDRARPRRGTTGQPAASGGSHGDYIVLNGQQVALKKHETDFSVMAPAGTPETVALKTAPLSHNLTRARARSVAERDQAMSAVREHHVAHHIYQVADTGEEVIIADRILLNLRREGTGELERILTEYHLTYEGQMGQAHVLRLTSQTGANPLKVANAIAQRPEVAACSPELVLPMQRHQTPALFNEQWYLTTAFMNHPDVLTNADVNAPSAWNLTTGDPNIVVAIIDDGFDLQHPALKQVRLHPERRDFMGSDRDPLPGPQDYHGTPVASITVGAHNGAAMRGLAPNCTFLPVRIGFGSGASHIDILEVFRFVSERADVVNCSFGLPPSSIDRMHPDFRAELARIAQTGGRRGKGLVMVFSAANDDAPTFLDGTANRRGVRFVSFNAFGEALINEIPPGRTVFSGYPMIQGVVVVGAMSSRKRKAGYSSWGPHVTVTAPSNNMHYIQSFITPGSDARREEYLADYRGLGQVAGCNRPGQGQPFNPIQRVDDLTTPTLEENFYTKQFGGTSGAAPVVTGIVALVLSVNPQLTAQEVRQILIGTADTDLDPTLDLLNDPNVQGLSGAFVNGASLFFGAGKVNAFRAVSRARDLNGTIGGGGGGTPPPTGTLSGEVRPNLAIPDNQPQGVVSQIDISGTGPLHAITVTVDITHSWRGDLRVTLIAPGGFPAVLHNMTGGSAKNLKRTYTGDTLPDLDNLVRGSINVQGRWTLHVSDNVQRDVGQLTFWRLALETS